MSRRAMSEKLITDKLLIIFTQLLLNISIDATITLQEKHLKNIVFFL